MKTEKIVLISIIAIIAISILGFVSQYQYGTPDYYGYNMYSMMGNFFGGFGFMWMFGFLFMILLITALVLLIIWLAKQISKK